MIKKTKIWTPENVVFDSSSPKIGFSEIGGNAILPKIYPLELEDPSHKELRYSQMITDWIIGKFSTRIDCEGIIGAGKTEGAAKKSHTHAVRKNTENEYANKQYLKKEKSIHLILV